MFDSLFENRNKFVSALIQLGDCLGHSLRKNVSLYSVDSNRGVAHYLTEDNKLIYGNIKQDDGIYIDDIQIVDSSILEDEEQFDELVLEQVENMISSVFNTKYEDATGEFEDILSLWNSRSKFESESRKLQERTQKFSNTKILDDSKFSRLDEIHENLVEFLQDNKEKFMKIAEVTNSVRLSNVLSESFDLPRMNYEDLVGNFYKTSNQFNTSIYEIVCSQELLSTELLEAKENFSNVWATNSKIKSLATSIFETNDNNVAERLSEAIDEVPFLALSSKKELRKTIRNSLTLLESNATDEEIIKYTAKLFEMKKPVKREIINFLNEKYGINSQNLTEIPSFKSLLNTQVVLFESLQKLSPKGSLQKEVLKEVASMLKTKTGVESIDVNTYISLLFEEAGYLEDLDVDVKVKSISLEEGVKGSDRIKELIKLISNSPEFTINEKAQTAEKGEESVAKASEDEQASISPEQANAIPGEEVAEAPPGVVSKKDFMSNLSELEELLKALSDDGQETSDKDMKEPDPVEEEKTSKGEEESEIHIDINSHNDDEEEGEEEEEGEDDDEDAVKVSKKPKKPKNSKKSTNGKGNKEEAVEKDEQYEE